MKKTILLLLTLTIVLCIFVSCDKVAEHDLLDKTNFETPSAEMTSTTNFETSSAEMTSTSTLKTEITGTETSNSSSENNQNDSNDTQADTLSNETSKSLEIETPEIERPLLSLWTQNEYIEFLNSAKLPDEFVTYEKLKDIGDFKALVILSDAYRGDYSSYMYGLVDSEGVEITLYVDHIDKVYSSSNTVSNVNNKDMRKLSEASKGYYVSTDIEYCYIPAGLLSISWEVQNITYTLYLDQLPLYDYPLTDSTFTGKMLNTDTARQALNSVFGEAFK